MARRPTKVSSFLSTRAGQGVTVFMLGGFTLGGLASIIFAVPGISNFIVSHLTFAPDKYEAWPNHMVALNNLLMLVATLIQIIVPTALAAVVAILGMRWLVGIRPQPSVLRGVVLWSVVVSSVVYSFNFALIFLIDWPHLDIYGQTITAYAQILSLGLPFSFAWLWCTRKQLSKKGSNK